MGFPMAKILEWVAISFSRVSSRPRDQTQVSHIAGRGFTIWAIREVPYAEYIMPNAVLEASQAAIKIAGRNINNLWYADDTTLMAESKELRSPLMKVNVESEKAGLKLNIKKTRIMASGPITSWQIDGETMETVTDYFLGLQNHCR